MRYIKVGGDPKHWELRECLKRYFGDKNPPERKNLEFLAALRDKIEHRHLPQLDATLYGECQAALLNLQDVLVDTFGPKFDMIEQLAVSLQFSPQVSAGRIGAAKKRSRSGGRPVIDFIVQFRNGLPSSVLNSMKYSFSVYLVPKVANRASAADVAVSFVKVDEASPEELKRLDRLNVLIREKHIPISNLGLFKPGEVVEEVAKKISKPMNLHVHTCAWKYYEVRPSGSTSKRAATRPEFCVYDETHEDYVYTEAWVRKLCKEFADPAVYAKVIGKTA